MDDLNSEFWQKIMEQQLLLDSTSPTETILTERLILYNENSELAELLTLIRYDDDWSLIRYVEASYSLLCSSYLFLRQKHRYDQENLKKVVYVPTTVSVLPGAKDIFDLTNLKRTIGKLMPQFANYR